MIKTPLNAAYASDVHKLAAEAQKAGGGLIYLCHPNNPTSVLTTRADMAWLVENLPANTYLLVDEAYLHYGTSPEAMTAMSFVKAGRVMSCVVANVFEDPYGMARSARWIWWLRGPDLIQRMEPFRNNVISIVAVRAYWCWRRWIIGSDLIEERRAKIELSHPLRAVRLVDRAQDQLHSATGKFHCH